MKYKERHRGKEVGRERVGMREWGRKRAGGGGGRREREREVGG